MEEKKILDINTVNDYVDFIGAPRQHPHINVVDLSGLQSIPRSRDPLQTVPQVPQVTLIILLSQIPSLSSLAFLHRMSDETFIASFAFVLRPPKWRPQRRRAMPIPLSIIYGKDF